MSSSSDKKTVDSAQRERAQRPPRDGLVRAVSDGPALQGSSVDGSLGTLRGQFAVFNQPTEINSVFEGRFIERIAPGAFDKTIAENRNSMKVLFDHGNDPQVGNKPLGPIESLSASKTGMDYEVALTDTSYNRDLLPSLKAGLLGSSFRFSVIKEDYNPEPKPSVDNPDGLPERVIREARVYEFGPVTFPAYEGAKAGVRSLSDEVLLARYGYEAVRPELRAADSDEEEVVEEGRQEADQDEETQQEEELTEGEEEEVEAPESEDAEEEVSENSPDDDEAGTESHSARGGNERRVPARTYRTTKPERPYWALGKRGKGK